MDVALQHLNRVISGVAPGSPLVFCGDFNSSPNSGSATTKIMVASVSTSRSVWLILTPICCFGAGVFQLVTQAVVPQQHADWSSSGTEESCSMELISAFPKMLSACSQPAYTNYVGGFHGCLDYIFIQPDIMQVLTLALVAV